MRQRGAPGRALLSKKDGSSMEPWELRKTRVPGASEWWGGCGLTTQGECQQGRVQRIQGGPVLLVGPGSVALNLPDAKALQCMVC